jgi:heme oxygenase (biliverdin-producing, ferredoxin)
MNSLEFSHISPMGGVMTGSTCMDQSSFSAELKAAGSGLHQKIEETPFVASLANGTVAEDSYKNYLADLFVIYDQLETELFLNQESEKNGIAEIIRPFTAEGLWRGALISQDLEAFEDAGRSPGNQAIAYKEHLVSLGQYHPHLLAAHAYIRYMGDLFGGQTIAKRLEERFSGKLATYDFTKLCQNREIERPVQFALTLRAQLDSVPLQPLQRSEILEEVAKGYEMHLALFKELESRALSL